MFGKTVKEWGQKMDTNGPLLVVSTVGVSLLHKQITEEPACDQRQSLKNGSSGLARTVQNGGMLFVPGIF
jgi:hypothetical protein